MDLGHDGGLKMPWSKNPRTYPDVFGQILFAAKEMRKSFTLTVPEGEEGKFRSQFYAYARSHLSDGDKREKRGDLNGAAISRANYEYLLRYAVNVEVGKIHFVNKNVVTQGLKLEVSREIVTDEMSEQIGIVLSADTHRAAPPEKKKSTKEAIIPLGFSTPKEKPMTIEQLKAKHPFLNPLPPEPAAPVPKDAEELALLEQVRREREESGEKHEEE